MEDLLTGLGGLKFVTTLAFDFKAKTIINYSDIDDLFESIYSTIKSFVRY